MIDLQQGEWEKINELSYIIISEVDFDKMRKLFLQKLCALIDFDLADFCIPQKEKGKGIHLIDPIVVSKYSKSFEAQFTSKYEEKFEEYDYTKWIFENSEVMVYIESEIINSEVRKKSAYYVQYLQPLNLTHVMGASIGYQRNPLGAVNLYRRGEKEDFTQREVFIMEKLLPFLQTVLWNRYLNQDQSKCKEEYIVNRVMENYGMSRRESEILPLICQGISNQEIAETLCITVNTVKKHISHILQKLEVDNRGQLIQLFLSQDRVLFDEMNGIY